MTAQGKQKLQIVLVMVMAGLAATLRFVHLPEWWHTWVPALIAACGGIAATLPPVQGQAPVQETVDVSAPITGREETLEVPHLPPPPSPPASD